MLNNSKVSLKTERNQNNVYFIWDFLFLIFRIKLKHIWKKWRKPLKDEIKKETFWIQKKNAKRDKVNATKAIRYYPVSVSLPRSRFCLVTQRSSLGWQVVTLTFVLVRTISITISWNNSLIVFFFVIIFATICVAIYLFFIIVASLCHPHQNLLLY